MVQTVLNLQGKAGKRRLNYFAVRYRLTMLDADAHYGAYLSK